MLWVPNKITNVPHLDDSMGIHCVRFNVDNYNSNLMANYITSSGLSSYHRITSHVCLLYTFFSDIILILKIVLVFNPEKLWESKPFVLFLDVKSSHFLSLVPCLKYTLSNVTAKTRLATSQKNKSDFFSVNVTNYLAICYSKSTYFSLHLDKTSHMV